MAYKWGLQMACCTSCTCASMACRSNQNTKPKLLHEDQQRPPTMQPEGLKSWSYGEKMLLVWDVDVSEIRRLPVNMRVIPLFTRIILHPRWLFGISEPSTVWWLQDVGNHLVGNHFRGGYIYVDNHLFHPEGDSLWMISIFLPLNHL